MSEEKLLLIWEEFPEGSYLYTFNKDSYLANLARNSNGLYINSDELEDGHAIFELNELLVRQARTATPIQDFCITEVVKCGFTL